LSLLVFLNNFLKNFISFGVTLFSFLPVVAQLVIVQWLNPSRRSVALGSTQPLKKRITKDLPWE
jgi:hypothetical protein